jgi:hypothetical protein
VSVRKAVATLLSLGLVFFLADGLFSFLGDSLSVAFGIAAFPLIRGLLLLLTLGMAAVLFVVGAASPMVPGRYIWPLVFFKPAAFLLLPLIAIYCFGHLAQIGAVIAVAQLAAGCAVLWAATGRIHLSWPVIREEQLGDPVFSLGRLAAFLFPAFLLVPGVLVYFGFCAALATSHFSDHFLALGVDGLWVRAKTFERSDGKSVELIPMIHVAEPRFYAQVARAFPTNAVVLLEGVTDDRHLLRQTLSYKRLASSLGLADQQSMFGPGPTRAQRADVDLSQFSAKTIELLNLVSRIHAQGLTPENIREWLQKAQGPEMLDRVWRDLLTLRNEHLLAELQRALSRMDVVTIPWGAAHMPGLARGLEKLNFHLAQERDYEVLRYRTLLKRREPAE